MIYYNDLAVIRCVTRYRDADVDIEDYFVYYPEIEGWMTIMGTLYVRLIDLSERTFKWCDERCFLGLSGTL